MKSWLIEASAPVCGTDTYYCAFCDNDPLDDPDFPYLEIIQELWDNYSYLLHLEDEEYESEEEEIEAYEQAYEDWNYDCKIISDEMPLDEIQDYLTGDIESNIIYDKRPKDNSANS